MSKQTAHDLTHGSRWWKFDFHAHTPHSSDFKQRAGTHAAVVSPGDWLRRYMEAGIDCVAVTDHNGGKYVDDLQRTHRDLAADPPGWFRPLVLFPGAEITSANDRHLLAIFDPDCGSDAVTLLLGKLNFADSDQGSAEASTSKSVLEVAGFTRECGGLLVPAHVDDPCGLFETHPDSGELLQGFRDVREALTSGSVFAIERMRMGESLHGSVAGLCEQWPCVLGTDWHNRADKPEQEPGARFTWVKMGEPNLEGLRLALHVGHPGSILRSDSVGADPNLPPALHLTGLEVKSARYAGRGENPLSVPFSPRLTTIIGGRGSGKSTVVQMIREMLGRGEELTGEVREEFKRFAKKGVGTEDGALTGDTEATLTVERNGQLFKLVWGYGRPGVEVFEVAADGSREPAPGNASSFPVRIYSQKQVYALAGNPSGLLGLIDQTPEVDRDAWDARWAEATNRHAALRAEARAQRAKLDERPKAQQDLQDLTRQIATLETGENRKVLNDQQSFVRQGRRLDERGEELEATRAAASEALDDWVPSNLPADSSTEEDRPEMEAYRGLLKGAHGIQKQFVRDVRDAIDRFADRAAQWEQERASSPWTAASAKASQAHNQLVRQLEADNVADPGQHQKLVQLKQALESRLKNMGAAETRATALDVEADQKAEEVLELRRELTRRRRDFLATLDDSEHVQIEIVGYGVSPAAAEEGFRSAIQKQDATLAGDILDEERERGLLVDLYQEEGLATDPAVRETELEARIAGTRRRCRAAAAGDQTGLGGHFANHLQKLMTEQPSQLDRLDLWFPEDDVTVKYRNDAGRWQPIRRASAGQKSAAVLAFILSHGDEPLILDQPEDDLDNHLIYHLIVKELTRTKRQRQVIVVTHNPNIVVNGDAELVNAMRFAGGQISRLGAQSGCLQDTGVRREVCEVMEGGREAFDRRYRRVVERIDDRKESKQ